ncbi:MAG: histidine--tRNA ligase [Candidatus Dormibacteraceae bacterium]
MPTTQPIRAARGVRDILPDELAAWREAERVTRRLVTSYGYREIEVPIIEPAALVERVGESTDVVQKEMYRFEDRGGRRLVLRPEATAGVVRAYFQGGLNQGPQPARLWLIGPMFRYGRPQAGRYREFHQLDVEALGDGSPAVDAEIIEIAWRWLAALGVGEITLQINSIGDGDCRPAYREALLAYYRPLKDRLCPDCQARLELNPLRMFDCKEERDQVWKRDAPKIVDNLCAPCAEAFAEVRSLLDGAGIPHVLNSELVRGLDYYSRTTFEIWPADPAGAQSALGGGGRYDGLARELGYPDIPAVGFAAGIERVMAAVAENGGQAPGASAAAILVLTDGAGLSAAAAAIARVCRRSAPAIVDYSNRSLRAKMRSANRLGVRWVVLVGAEEAARRVVQLREMVAGEQAEVAWDDLPGRLGAPT